MKKFLWAIIAFVFGFLFFLSVNQLLGAGIVSIGIILLDNYMDERKDAKQNNYTKL